MRNEDNRPTVLDVAKRAGVSPSTVSRHLRNLPNIKEANAAKVEQAVRELGYVPNELARGLRGGKSKTIGVLIPTFLNAFFSLVAREIERAAQHHGYNVLLLTHDEQLALQDEHLLTLRRYRADGILLAPAPGTSTHQVRTLAESTPLVCFDRTMPEIDSVSINNRTMARIATEHLLQHGYRDITGITIGPTVQTVEERIQGYMDTMQAAGLEAKICPASAYGQAGQPAKTGTEPRAILSLHNSGTVEILSRLRTWGAAARKRTFMIGFDDMPLAALLESPLTVINQPTHDMGRIAVQKLMARIHPEKRSSRTDVEHKVLAGKLILRQSCGCK